MSKSDLPKASVAVVGASGAVGREMLNVLHQRQFPASSLRVFASERSVGEEVEFGEETLTLEALTPGCFRGVDIALFSAGASVSAKVAPDAVESGTIVIDNSSQFRMYEQVPLVVPEVNGSLLRSFLQDLGRGKGAIIANPNCSTIQLVVVLQPLQAAAGLRRVVVSTYQSVSGAGKKGMDELWEQTLALFNQQELKIEKFAHRIAFNCLPHIDVFQENGYTKEEMKVINETRKIMNLPQLKITATAVRVPVFACHSESVNVETEKALSPEQAREILRSSPGVVVLDQPGEKEYPLPINLAGTDATYVGRIRADESVEHGLNMWVVADNLRKGAALNAVQIAEVVLGELR